MVEGMTDLYTLFGNPVQHSKSPEIHAHFAKTTSQNLTYQVNLVALGAFEAAVKQFIRQGGKGANVTVPFKVEAYHLCEELTKEAQQAKAVNTLYFHNGKISGHNTDGIGFLRDLTLRHCYSLHNKRIAILGAGGATQGILGPLLEQQPASICLINRHVEKAQTLCLQFNHHQLYAADWSSHFETVDLLINATSAGLESHFPNLPQGLVGQKTFAYDLMYRTEGLTPFLTQLQSHKLTHSVDGLGMLVEQAAESFYCWRHVYPNTEEIYQRLRSG